MVVFQLSMKPKKHSDIVGSKPILPVFALGLNVAFALRANSAGQNSTSTNQMMPAQAAMIICTNNKCESNQMRVARVRVSGNGIIINI